MPPTGFTPTRRAADGGHAGAGDRRHPYSAHKAEVEDELAEALEGSDTDAYVFRPCIVAGPEATLLLDLIPLLAIGQRIPGAAAVGARQGPRAAPVLPDPGVPFQLVHHDDVAAALCAAVVGDGEPGVYNLAGPGQMTLSDLAHALGWHCGAGPAPRRRSGRRGGGAPAVPARRGRLDRDPPPAGADGHLQGARRAALEAAPRRRGHAARDGRAVRSR